MRLPWISCVLVLAVGCGGDLTPDLGDSVDARDVVEPIDPELVATIVLPDLEPMAFTANVLVTCEFEKPGQLRITGSAVSAEETKNLSLRLGVEERELPEEGLMVPLMGVSGAEDVLWGEGAITWSGSGVSALLLLEGSVTLHSLDPCEGVFEALVGLVDGGEMAVQEGGFLIPRESE